MKLKNIGEVLRKRREILGFTREQLAEKADVNPQTIYKIETGQTQPRVINFVVLCYVLGLKIEDFIEEEEA